MDHPKHVDELSSSSFQPSSSPPMATGPYPHRSEVSQIEEQTFNAVNIGYSGMSVLETVASVPELVVSSSIDKPGHSDAEKKKNGVKSKEDSMRPYLAVNHSKIRFYGLTENALENAVMRSGGRLLNKQEIEKAKGKEMEKWRLYLDTDTKKNTNNGGPHVQAKEKDETVSEESYLITRPSSKSNAQEPEEMISNIIAFFDSGAFARLPIEEQEAELDRKKAELNRQKERLAEKGLRMAEKWEELELIMKLEESNGLNEALREWERRRAAKDSTTIDDEGGGKDNGANTDTSNIQTHGLSSYKACSRPDQSLSNDTNSPGYCKTVRENEKTPELSSTTVPESGTAKEVYSMTSLDMDIVGTGMASVTDCPGVGPSVSIKEADKGKWYEIIEIEEECDVGEIEGKEEGNEELKQEGPNDLSSRESISNLVATETLSSDNTNLAGRQATPKSSETHEPDPKAVVTMVTDATEPTTRDSVTLTTTAEVDKREDIIIITELCVDSSVLRPSNITPTVQENVRPVQPQQMTRRAGKQQQQGISPHPQPTGLLHPQPQMGMSHPLPQTGLPRHHQWSIIDPRQQPGRPLFMHEIEKIVFHTQTPGWTYHNPSPAWSIRDYHPCEGWTFYEPEPSWTYCDPSTYVVTPFFPSPPLRRYNPTNTWNYWNESVRGWVHCDGAQADVWMHPNRYAPFLEAEGGEDWILFRVWACWVNEMP